MPANTQTICCVSTGPSGQLPLTQRILDTGDEAALLLLLTDLQPVFDELDTAIDNEQFKLRANLEKAAVLLVCAEAHDALHARAVVPAAVKDHDLARRREVGDVALQIQLPLLTIRRRRQRDDAEHARGLTRSVIALIVPPFPAASRPSKTTTTREPGA